MIEPLFQKVRSFYRGTRSSELDNLESNLFIADVSRVNENLDNVDNLMLSQVVFLAGDKTDVDDQVHLDNGLSYPILDTKVSYGLVPSVEVDVYVDPVFTLSSRLERIRCKVQRLEQ